MKLKTTFSILIFSFFFFQNINSQSFVDEGNQWSLVQYNFMGDGFTSTYRIEGDTLLNGIIYKKLLMTEEDPAMVVNWTESKYIREDSTKKIFQFDGTDDGELIYDFGLSVGDTVFFNNSSIYDYDAIVDAVDSVELNDGTMRKRLALSSLHCPDWGIQEYWIEGIGGVNLALSYINQFCIFDVGTFLRCFSNNGDFLYGNLNGENCFIINSTNELEQTAIKIFPNPTQDILNLEYSETIKIEQLKIFDFQGQLIKSLQVENDLSPISISNFPKGVYYLKIETAKSKFVFKKFIKI